MVVEQLRKSIFSNSEGRLWTTVVSNLSNQGVASYSYNLMWFPWGKDRAREGIFELFECSSSEFERGFIYWSSLLPVMRKARRDLVWNSSFCVIHSHAPTLQKYCRNLFCLFKAVILTAKTCCYNWLWRRSHFLAYWLCGCESGTCVCPCCLPVQMLDQCVCVCLGRLRLGPELICRR